MYRQRVLLAGLISSLILAVPATAKAQDRAPLRGEVIAKLDRTSHTLGELCTSSDGTVYAENERREKAEIVRLDRNGKILWQSAVFDGARTASSTFGPCDATGAVYGVHSFVGPGIYRSSVTRISAAGKIEWTRDIAVPGCTSTLLFGITQDSNGAIYVGGQAEKCPGNNKQGYVVRLSRDGQLSGVIPLEEMEQVRHISSDGSQIIAVGRIYGGTAIVSLAANGALRWARTDEDLNLPGPIEGVATGAGGTYICAVDFRAKALVLARLDSQGSLAGSWSYANRNTPTLSDCLISDPLRQSLALIAEGSGTLVEVVRIPAEGTPTIGTLLDNPLGLTRGHGISDDGRTFYIGGPDSDKGPSKTQIMRYTLPDAQNVQRVFGTCLTPESRARIDAKRRLADEAARASRKAVDARIESLLQNRTWTPEQKRDFRARQPLLVQDEYFSKQEDLVRQFEQQLATASGADCEPIEFQLGSKLESLKRLSEGQQNRADQIAQQALFLGRPDGVAPTDDDLRFLLLRWAQRIHPSVVRAWRRPEVTLPGTCRIEMSLAPDGRLLGARVVESSGNAEFDASALAAIEQAAPYPPPLKPLSPATAIRMIFPGKKSE